MGRWLPVGLLGGLLVIALAVAARPEVDRSEGARVQRIAQEVRCPTCRGLSAAESDAEAATAVKTFIRDRLRQGSGDAEIKAELADRFGPSILLRPPASGVSGLVWALPVAALVLAGGGLAYAFRRWRTRGLQTASDDDVVLVERARRA
ncbi:MAG: cytochrome c-type biogenesis protein CcmH [Acidimicrobiales bacterium]